MPGPPAPFVPTPLPNIAKSNMSPKGFSKDVKIEGKTVAIFGASFKSMGDVASKGTGGGLLSMNTHGPAKFVCPGSLTVRIEGKAVHLKGDPMLNNLGAAGAPPNTGATLTGVDRSSCKGESAQPVLQAIATTCDEEVSPTDASGQKKSCTKLGNEKHACCETKIQEHRAKNKPNGKPPIEGERGYRRPKLDGDSKPVPGPDGSFPPPQPTGGPRPDLAAAFAKGGSAVRQAFAQLKGNCYPDAAIINDDGSKTFADFKFPCPEGHPSGKGKSKGGVRTQMNRRQQESYNALGYGTGSTSQAVTILP